MSGGNTGGETGELTPTSDVRIDARVKLSDTKDLYG
jgi:hypothetical protein